MRVFKTICIASIGSVLEYYDFITYALLAHYLAIGFFADLSPVMAMLNTLLIFAVGYIMRPIGGVVFGAYADRFGRKKAFMLSIILMAASTFCIGLLPMHMAIGTVLLLILRLIQGFSQGAEISSAVTFTSEYSQSNSRAFNCSILFSAIGLGAILSSVLCAYLSAHITRGNMQSFGWRIPFLLGGVLAIVGYWLRVSVAETPEFKRIEADHRRSPLRELLCTHPLEVLLNLLIVLFPASTILFVLYLPSYVQTYFHFPMPAIHRAMTLGLIWATVTLPLFGALADRIGKRWLLSIVAFVTVLASYSMFSLLVDKNTASLIGFVISIETITAASTATAVAHLCESFGTEVRATAVGFCYNMAFVLAALTPLSAGYLIQSFEHPMGAALLFPTMAVICLFAIWLQPKCSCLFAIWLQPKCSALKRDYY